MARTKWGTFQAAVCKLRKKLPPKYPISVRRRNLNSTNCVGYCVKNGKKFQIVVCNTLNEDSAVLILIHEFAHALAWGKENDHDAIWGRCYAKCWRVFTDDF